MSWSQSVELITGEHADLSAWYGGVWIPSKLRAGGAPIVVLCIQLHSKISAHHIHAIQHLHTANLLTGVD